MVLDNFAFTLGTLAKNVAIILYIISCACNWIKSDQIKSKLEIHMSYYKFVNL